MLMMENIKIIMGNIIIFKLSFIANLFYKSVGNIIWENVLLE